MINTIKDINSIPIAVNMSATSEAGAAVEIELVATDADYDPLTFSIVTQPSIGTVTISGKMATYTPNENADGTDTFTYKANDGTADSNTATATINVNGSFTLGGTYTKDNLDIKRETVYCRWRNSYYTCWNNYQS